MMKYQQIISKLPYSKPFLFVDEILRIDENGVEGTYSFDKDLEFYKGHFTNHPVIPGVILTEVMAQIGVVSLGIYLFGENINEMTSIAMTSTEMEFLKPVYPQEKVFVKSKKIYFRFGKLKCEVTMKNEAGVEVCHGKIAGIISN